MNKTITYIFSLLLMFMSSKGMSEEFSVLYGKDGTLWQQPSRIADFSHAGYHGGDTAIPNLANSKDVKVDFGAKGDGLTDDTKAFLNAISTINQANNGGVLFIPEGAYVITKFLKLNKSNLVIRGAGKDKTVLLFPKSCMEIEPRTQKLGAQTINWYHGMGGVIWAEGNYGQSLLANITVNAKRGDQSITVNSSNSLQVGQLVEIAQQDLQGTLTDILYQGLPGENKPFSAKPWQMVKVKAINGLQIQLDRPLIFDVETRWTPKINSFNPTVKDIGIENLTISMGRDIYDGHFFEEWNAIYFHGISDSWVRNVDVKNADEAFLIFGRFCTLDNIGYSVSTPSKEVSLGHNGIFFDGPGSDNLCQNFKAGAVFAHSLSVRNSYGNVFSKGVGNGIDFDMASQAPHSNLFTQIDIGHPSKIWTGSGAHTGGKSAAAFNTFWNIKASSSIAVTPEKSWSLSQNVIGITTSNPPTLDPLGRWFEPIKPENISPQNLYEHQRDKRLKKTNNSPTANAGPNRTINLTATASLDGRVTDDGLPAPSTVTQTWTKVSGPGTVTFASASAVDTTATFSMAGTYVLRLTASDGALSASDEVSVTVAFTSPSLPAPWVGGDVGSPSPVGSSSHLGGNFTLQGAGADIYGAADSFHSVSQPVSGDCSITARVTGVQNTNAWAKAGVMVRETRIVGSRHAFMAVTPSNGVSFQRRLATNGTSSNTTQSGYVAPYWLRLVRSGNTLTGFRSADGVTWVQVGSDTVTMSDAVQVGLAVTSHANGTLCTATFDQVSVTTSTTPTITLMNADNEQVISAFHPITNNATIALSSLTTDHLNIRANVSGVGSVRFVWTGAESGIKTESTAPYAMKNDTDGNYSAWTPSLGTYQVTITTYTGRGATGSVLQTATFQFTVTDPTPPAAILGG